MEAFVVTAIAVIALFGAADLYMLPKLDKAKAYIARFSECGALPPLPGKRAVRRWQIAARIFLFIQVGKVRYVGLEKSKVPGPRLIAPNHGSSMDGFPFLLKLDKPVRSLATQGLFKFAGGLGALLFGPGGAIPVDLTPGKGAPALDAGVRVLTSGQSLLMFPEGWAYMNGKIGPFKKGAVRIARKAGQELGSPAYIVPVYLRYGKYPGDWILKFPPPIQYILALMLFPLYRRGLTVVFGDPISSDELHPDDAIATENLKQTILALDPKKTGTATAAA